MTAKVITSATPATISASQSHVPEPVFPESAAVVGEGAGLAVTVAVAVAVSVWVGTGGGGWVGEGTVGAGVGARVGVAARGVVSAACTRTGCTRVDDRSAVRLEFSSAAPHPDSSAVIARATTSAWTDRRAAGFSSATRPETRGRWPGQTRSTTLKDQSKSTKSGAWSLQRESQESARSTLAALARVASSGVAHT